MKMQLPLLQPLGFLITDASIFAYMEKMGRLISGKDWPVWVKNLPQQRNTITPMGTNRVGYPKMWFKKLAKKFSFVFLIKGEGYSYPPGEIQKIRLNFYPIRVIPFNPSIPYTHKRTSPSCPISDLVLTGCRTDMESPVKQLCVGPGAGLAIHGRNNCWIKFPKCTAPDHSPFFLWANVRDLTAYTPTPVTTLNDCRTHPCHFP